jgi:Domain of unknown function (DUF4145)
VFTIVGSSTLRRSARADIATPRRFIAQKDHDVSKTVLEAPESINGSLNGYFKIEGFICLRNMGAVAPPEFVPDTIAAAFREGATCVATDCPNAAGAMFRLAIDLTTWPLLPAAETAGLNSKVRRDLGLRLPWLFENNLLPRELEDLSRCIREDANDGAHAGTLTRDDALDLQDFSIALLERIFTEPERLRLAADRRAERRVQITSAKSAAE